MEGFDLSTISNVYVGSTQYSEIYYGSNKVWPTQSSDIILLDYVLSANNGIIDFGFVPDENTTIEVLYKSAIDLSDGNILLFNHYVYPYVSSGYTVTYDQDSIIYDLNITNPQKIKFVGNSVIIDDFVKFNVGNNYITPSTNLTSNQNGIIFYNIKIINGNTIISLRPCKYNNTYGFFDIYTRTIYIPSGGNWIGGNIAPYNSCVEYLAITANNVTLGNTSFIDSEIIPTDSTGMKVIALVDGNWSNLDTYLYGTREDGSNTRYVIGYSDGDGWYIGFNSFLHATSQSFGGNKSKIMVENNYMNKRSSPISDYCNNGTNFGWLSRVYYNPLSTQTHSIYVDANSGQQSTKFVAHKTYMFSISEGKSTVRYFIPVRVNSEGCYYDLILGKLYHNIGGSSYTCGNDC